MAYYTVEEIKSIGGIRNIPNIRQKNLERKLSATKTTVFLSHSHEDNDIVESVLAFFLNMGILIYVDWLDPAMPRTTSGETAVKIKEKIRQCDRFVVLLTENSRDSKWVPWELGYADGNKKNEDISIMPVKRNYYTDESSFNGLEYMQLYQTIKVGVLSGQNIPSVFAPGSNSGTVIKSWLNR